MIEGQWAVMVESPVTGAGADGVRHLRRLGVSTLLLAHRPESLPGYLREQLEREQVVIVQVDTQSVEAMADTVEHYCGTQPAAVLSFYEYYAAQAALLARHFGLPGPDPRAVEICRNKGLQRDALQTTTVSLAYERCQTAAQAEQAALRLKFPVIVKPTNLTGSVLVRRCDRAEDVRSAATAILTQGAYLGVPVAAEVLVEEFIPGSEYSVELMHGDVVTVTSKELAAGTVIEIAHTVPAPCSERVRNSLGRAAVQACEAVGLLWGPAHVELKLDEATDRTAVIEINARVAGDRIPELVRLSNGRDLVYEQVCAALSRELVPERHQARVATICFSRGPGGRLRSVASVDDARATANVEEVQVRIGEGQLHQLKGSNQDRVAWAIATGFNEASARRSALEALDRLSLDWVPSGCEA